MIPLGMYLYVCICIQGHRVHNHKIFSRTIYFIFFLTLATLLRTMPVFLNKTKIAGEYEPIYANKRRNVIFDRLVDNTLYKFT